VAEAQVRLGLGIADKIMTELNKESVIDYNNIDLDQLRLSELEDTKNKQELSKLLTELKDDELRDHKDDELANLHADSSNNLNPPLKLDLDKLRQIEKNKNE